MRTSAVRGVWEDVRTHGTEKPYLKMIANIKALHEDMNTKPSDQAA